MRTLQELVGRQDVRPEQLVLDAGSPVATMVQVAVRSRRAMLFDGEGTRLEGHP